MTTSNDEADRIAKLAHSLIQRIRPLTSCAVAFSGGVDSAVVAAAARRGLGDRSLAVTGVGPSLAEGELETARRVAQQIGIRHIVVPTRETEIDAYRRNDSRRCFHCKSHLYEEIAKLRTAEGFRVILSGTNQDDLGDIRPGLVAAENHGVLHPLAECGMDKRAVRELARWFGLEIAEKPATPCLASRFAYGVTVTDDRLRQVDAAERFLRELGFQTLRVRYHDGPLARIEVPTDQIARLANESNRGRIVDKFRELGFRAVALDLRGFRSGGLNELALVEIHPNSASTEPLSHAKPSP